MGDVKRRLLAAARTRDGHRSAGLQDMAPTATCGITRFNTRHIDRTARNDQRRLALSLCDTHFTAREFTARNGHNRTIAQVQEVAEGKDPLLQCKRCGTRHINIAFHGKSTA